MLIYSNNKKTVKKGKVTEHGNIVDTKKIKNEIITEVKQKTTIINKQDKKIDINSKINRINSFVSKNEIEILDRVAKNDLLGHIQLIKTTIQEIVGKEYLQINEKNNNFQIDFANMFTNNYTSDKKTYNNQEIIALTYISFLFANKKAGATWKRARLIEVNDKHYHIESIKQNFDSKLYKYDIQVNQHLDINESFRQKEVNKGEHKEENGKKIIYEEIYTKLNDINIVDRYSINAFNQCVLNCLALQKRLFNKYQQNNHKTSLIFDTLEEKIENTSKIIYMFAMECCNSIYRATSEGMKGSKKRNDMQFISINEEISEGREYSELLKGENVEFIHIINQYNLKDKLTKEEYKIMYSLYIGYTVREIKDMYKIGHKKITDLRKKMYGILKG